MMRDKVKLMEITKREIIASVVIIAFMLIIGFMISDKITDVVNDKNAEYQKAIHIDNAELFQYGMDTNVGNAFVYGDLESVDTVTYPEIGGEYIYVKKVEERYERHEEWVEDDDGNRTLKVTYDWETESTESQHADEIKFCGIIFPYGKIQLPSARHITTIKGDKVWSWKSGERVKVRFQYYGVATKHTGTTYTTLKDKIISDNTPFYKDCTIEQALEQCTSNGDVIVFWVIWIILTAGLVYGFYYLDNNWLEN